jgi:NAD(P)-dependent dehydrogenase (short-subunit alcohol dehydrogenase family)
VVSRVVGRSRVAVVTGANQGLGYALVEGLCRTMTERDIVYLTCRNEPRGAAAVIALRAHGLAPRLHLLDVAEPASIASFADTVRREHGGVDVVINNAGARTDPAIPAAAQVRTLITTSNLGTTRMIEAFGPLLRDGGRFLVVASSAGQLRHLPAHLHARFLDANSLRAVDDVMLAYADTVERGLDSAEGWPAWTNIASKVGQIATMRVFASAMRHEAAQRGLVIDAVCPGLVDTPAARPWVADMSTARTPAEAAVDIVWLATTSDTPLPYGELVRRRRILSWTNQTNDDT